MKSIKPLSLIGLSLILSVTSCTIEKRVYMSGYHIEWNKKRQNANSQELGNFDNIKQTEQIQIASVQQSENDDITIDNAPPQNDETISASVDNSPIPMNIASSLHDNSSIIVFPDECDVITLKNGEDMEVKVTEVTTDEIKYKKCNNLNGPTYSIKKPEVFMIRYANGTKDIISPTNTQSNNSASSSNTDTDRKIEAFGIAGFIASLVGLIVFGIPLGALAVIFGAISLGKISKHPEKFKGKGFAISSICIGVIAIVAAIIIILSTS